MPELLSEFAEVGDDVLGLELTSANITKAYLVGKKLFDGKTRLSGEPYFTHCVEVARILQKEWNITNEEVIIAAILHDSIEDTIYTYENISRDFGQVVADLVNGVTNLRNSTDHETVKKVLGKETVNLGVAAIKLADRLHNMRTLGSMSRHKQVAKARETMDVYTRLAESIGFWQAKVQLEDLSFEYLEPENYQRVKFLVDEDIRSQSIFKEYHSSTLVNILSSTSFCEILESTSGGYWEIYDKWQKRAKLGECSPDSLKDIEDVNRYVIQVPDIDAIYFVAGRIKQRYSGSVDFNHSHEYLGKDTRSNGYQANEIVIKTEDGNFIVSLVTPAMHRFNRFGAVELINSGEYVNRTHDLIYVFTNTGRIRFLPQGSTGYDFAAQIDPALLATGESILVDGARKELSTVLKNGSDLEVITSHDLHFAPSAYIESFCNLPSTRRLVAEQRITQERNSVTLQGKQKLEPYLSRLGLLDLVDINNLPEVVRVLSKYGCGRSIERLYFMLGNKALLPESVAEDLGKILKSHEHIGGFSTIRLRGKDGNDILKTLVDSVPDQKSIYTVSHTPGDIFELRLVVRDLTTNEVEEVVEELKKKLTIDKLEIDFASCC